MLTVVENRSVSQIGVQVNVDGGGEVVIRARTCLDKIHEL